MTMVCILGIASSADSSTSSTWRRERSQPSSSRSTCSCRRRRRRRSSWSSSVWTYRDRCEYFIERLHFVADNLLTRCVTTEVAGKVNLYKGKDEKEEQGM